MASEKKNLEQGTRSMWSGKWAFILAAAGSAVGLGNIWRFPYLAAKYGGGMFLLTYLVLVFTVGFSLLLLETALGRKTGLSAIGAFKSFGKKFAFIGVITAIVPFLVVPYYSIIGGWVMKYAVSYVALGSEVVSSPGFFDAFRVSPETYLWLLLFIAIVFAVVSFGVKGGIEKANLVMMPTLIVMAIALAIFTMTMPGAMDGILYYLTPDFSKFSAEMVIGALGQMFYSLSLAMAIMITYGSYLDKKENLAGSAACVCSFDVGISFLAGLIIVPAAFVAMGSGEAVAGQAGPSLMFVSLPSVFSNMGAAASVLGGVFFILVLFAALTSAISLAEACVSIVQDATKWTRKRAVAVVFAVTLTAGLIINAGYNGLSFIQPLGEGSSILDLVDFSTNSVLMPLAALLTCVFVGWIITPKTLVEEIKISSTFKLEGVWTFAVRYVAPVLVLVILVAYTAQQFGLFSM